MSLYSNKMALPKYLSSFKAKRRSKFIYLSWRYRISYIAFFGMFLMYCMRINMSLAIVCMVKPPTVDLNATLIESTTGSSYNGTIEGVDEQCQDLTKRNRSDLQTGTFEWSRPLQGTVLSTYFYGYMITQLPGGWLSRRFGTKIVILVGLGTSAISSLLIPVAATWSVYAVMVLRGMIGLGSAVTFPSYHNLWSQWAPIFERTKLVTISIAGSTTGNIVIFFVSGLLCVYGFSGGWPSIFYLSGLFTLAWLVIWAIFVYDSPAQHPWISDEERQEIEDNIRKEVKHEKNESTPWLQFAKSLPCWAIIVAQLCNNYGSYTMMVCLPIYMKDVLKFDMKQNGVYMALPYLVMSIMIVIVGQIVDILRARGVGTALVRKVCLVAGCGVPAVLLIGAGFIDCHQRMVAVALLIVAVGFTSFTRSAYVVNHLDIAPKYAAVLYGISNTFGTFPGFAAPLVVGQLTTSGTREEWQTIFYICAGIYTFGIIFYCIFAKGRVQPWALADLSNERPYTISDPFPEDLSLHKADSLELTLADEAATIPTTGLMASLEDVLQSASDSDEEVNM